MSRPEDPASSVQAGQDSAVGKDFNKDIEARLDPLNKNMFARKSIDGAIPNLCLKTAQKGCFIQAKKK